MILHQQGDYPVFFVLIANENRPILKSALQLFAKSFKTQFSAEVIEHSVDIGKFRKADEIVDETFPFVVSYL